MGKSTKLRTPLKNTYTKVLKKEACNKSIIKKLHEALPSDISKYIIKNKLFTYTCYSNENERLVIAEYHPKKGTNIYYTNLKNHGKRILFIGPTGEIETDNDSYQMWVQLPKKTNSIVRLYLDDFYKMHVELFSIPENTVNSYFKAIMSAPEIPWEEEVIYFRGKRKYSEQIWWNKGLEQIHIVKRGTGGTVNFLYEARDSHLIASENFDFSPD